MSLKLYSRMATQLGTLLYLEETIRGFGGGEIADQGTTIVSLKLAGVVVEMPVHVNLDLDQEYVFLGLDWGQSVCVQLDYDTSVATLRVGDRSIALQLYLKPTTAIYPARIQDP